MAALPHKSGAPYTAAKSKRRAKAKGKKVVEHHRAVTPPPKPIDPVNRSAAGYSASLNQFRAIRARGKTLSMQQEHSLLRKSISVANHEASARATDAARVTRENKLRNKKLAAAATAAKEKAAKVKAKHAKHVVKHTVKAKAKTVTKAKGNKSAKKAAVKPKARGAARAGELPTRWPSGDVTSQWPSAWVAHDPMCVAGSIADAVLAATGKVLIRRQVHQVHYMSVAMANGRPPTIGHGLRAAVSLGWLRDFYALAPEEFTAELAGSIAGVETEFGPHSVLVLGGGRGVFWGAEQELGELEEQYVISFHAPWDRYSR